jgi:hypothetical protein
MFMRECLHIESGVWKVECSISFMRNMMLRICMYVTCVCEEGRKEVNWIWYSVLEQPQ